MPDLPQSTESHSIGKPRQLNHAALALSAGILVSLLLTGLIWLLGPRLEPIRATLLPDSGASWYYWRLPVETWGAKLSAWVFYLLHQLAIWSLIFSAQRAARKNEVGYSTRLHWFNYAALGTNALLGLVHIAQTHIWYDAPGVSLPKNRGMSK